MQDIKELSLEELEELLVLWAKPAFSASQIFSWIYKKNASDFNSMTNISQYLMVKLKENFFLFGMELAKRLKSRDGTEKFLLRLKDKNVIEAVSIPAENRITGCISTQVGCKYACKFCASGLLGFQRNLTSGEMIEEALFIKKNNSHKKLTHIVFMGIGEPLDNYDNLMKAIRTINSKHSLSIGARRITVSTCGIIAGIKKLAKEGLQIELSVSLHAADDKTRSKIMPVNKIYPLKDLISACSEYIKRTGRQITFEYVLIKGLNSDLQNARNLSKILKGLRLCKVNLISANRIEKFGIAAPDKSDILRFKNYLSKEGLNITLRKPRGEDIKAACGQLRLSHE